MWFSILGALPFALMLPYANLFWTGVLAVVVAGILGLLIRLELSSPGMQFVTPDTYNQLLTGHGAVTPFTWKSPRSSSAK